MVILEQVRFWLFLEERVVNDAVDWGLWRHLTWEKARSHETDGFQEGIIIISV